jgi:hypothetical protein
LRKKHIKSNNFKNRKKKEKRLGVVVGYRNPANQTHFVRLMCVGYFFLLQLRWMIVRPKKMHLQGKEFGNEIKKIKILNNRSTVKCERMHSGECAVKNLHSLVFY